MNDLKTKKILVIVESPNKCSTITSILKNAGYTNVTVAASLGHIMELGDGGNYHNSGIDPTNNFELNLKISQEKYDTVKKLKALARTSDLIYLMSDGDREGELIAWSLIKFLGLPKEKFLRAITHEITPNAVLNALENSVKFSDAMVQAALARLTIDKMIGYTLSPIAKSYVGARSVGRCQSAGLKLVVDREHEIQNFTPEYYYDLYLTFIKNNNTFSAKYIGTAEQPVDRIMSTETLNNIKAECTGDFLIQSIKQSNRKEAPKPPYCTATFQQDAATKLGLKVKDAMSCAQKLFEGVSINGKHIGLITYMRTDSTTISKEFIPELESYINELFIPGSFCMPKAGKRATAAQEGHEAIRVVDPKITPEDLRNYLQNDLLIKVYSLIWQRTIASALPPAEISETVYIINNSKHLFKMTSSVLLKPGYRIIYGTSPTEETEITEKFKVHEKLLETELEAKAKQTKPPARYTEASLINELQQRAIGRPSTYVAIVETMLSPNRGYCTVENKTIIPTTRGIQLAGFLDRSFSDIINLEYTKQLEESLDAIASKKLDKQDFLLDFYRKLEYAMAKNVETIGDTLQLAEKYCPSCGSAMVVRRSRYGKLFYGCSQYPNCRSIIGID